MVFICVRFPGVGLLNSKENTFSVFISIAKVPSRKVYQFVQLMMSKSCKLLPAPRGRGSGTQNKNPWASAAHTLSLPGPPSPGPFPFHLLYTLAFHQKILKGEKGGLLCLKCLKTI